MRSNPGEIMKGNQFYKNEGDINRLYKKSGEKECWNLNRIWKN